MSSALIVAEPVSECAVHVCGVVWIDFSNINYIVFPLKVHKHEIFFILFLQKPKPYGPKGLLHEIFRNCIRVGRYIRLLNISAHAQHAMKSVPSMLSMR